MAGHSKWAKLKHKKPKTDQARGKLFSKIIREITAAARLGGGNPDFNPRLRSAIEAAKDANMPADNIEKAIKRGVGELPGVVYEEAEYEGYGPGGVAMIVRVLTDNKNRTTQEIRSIFSRYGGNLGATGCVAWQFKPKGVFYIPKECADEDTIISLALEAGAEDVKTEKDSYQIITPPESFFSVKKKLEAMQIVPEHAELTKLPQNLTPVDEKTGEKVLKLYSALEELEEVQQVYANFDIAEDLMEKLAVK